MVADSPDDDVVEEPSKWAVSLVTAVAVAFEFGLLYWQLKDTADVIILRAKVKKWWAKVSHCEGCERRKLYLKEKGHVVFEAIQIVGAVSE